VGAAAAGGAAGACLRRGVRRRKRGYGDAHGAKETKQQDTDGASSSSSSSSSPSSRYNNPKNGEGGGGFGAAVTAAAGGILSSVSRGPPLRREQQKQPDSNNKTDAAAAKKKRMGRKEPRYIPRRKHKTFREAVRHLISGACAGALAKSLEAPVDRVKIMMQCSADRFSYSAAMGRVRNIVTSEGLPGLWKGNLPVLCRVVPYAAINFAVHDLVSGVLSEDGESLRPHMKFISGAIAGATSTISTYPLDTVRARMAVSTKGVNRTVIATLRDGWMRGGNWCGLYAGLTPSLCGIIPYSGTTWLCFETFKEVALRRKGLSRDGDLPSLELAAFGGLSAIIGQIVSYPLDVCRRRMQTASRAGVTLSMVSVLRGIYQQEGLHGLYKGISVNFVKAPIAHGISFATYHALKKKMAEQKWP